MKNTINNYSISGMILIILVVAVLTLTGYNHDRSEQPDVYVEIIVDYGDTLWTIAKSIAPNVDPRKVVWDIQKLNQIDQTMIYPGQVLQVPDYHTKS